MHYHLILTERCNLKCSYCYGKSMEEENELDKKFSFDFNVPEKFDVEINDLKKFIMQDKKPTIIFYGGEPLLNIPKIKEIMDEIDANYRMQTNGMLLHLLDKNYINRISKILVSIDGNEDRTDKNRGKLSYRLIMKNISKLRENGYEGEIIARMTITPPHSDLYEQVKHLLDAGFSSIHWQIDCGFYKGDYNFDLFKKFINEYNLSLTKLIDFWIKELSNGNFLMIYPFVGVAESILNFDKSQIYKDRPKLKCGAGYEGYAITTNGKIVACPIMNGIKDFEAGTIYENINDLKKFDVGGKCLDCNEYDLCGGRCLYWRETNLWKEEGDELICESIRHLLNEIKNKMIIIDKLIEKKIINKNNFNYEKYFGPEIIP